MRNGENLDDCKYCSNTGKTTELVGYEGDEMDCTCTFPQITPRSITSAQCDEVNEWLEMVDGDICDHFPIDLVIIERLKKFFTTLKPLLITLEERKKAKKFVPFVYVPTAPETQKRCKDHITRLHQQFPAKAEVRTPLAKDSIGCSLMIFPRWISGPRSWSNCVVYHKYSSAEELADALDNPAFFDQLVREAWRHFGDKK